MSLDDDIALDQLAPGRYRCHISENQWLAAGPNGGYLAALLAHAGDTNLSDNPRQLRGLTVHYLRPPAAAEAEIEVSVEQLGRSVAFQRVVLRQADRPILLATGTWADARAGIEHKAWDCPEAPDPGDCEPMTSIREDGPFPIHQQWDIRSASGRVLGDGGDAELSWWIRPPVHRPLDAPMLIAMSDALPPPIFMVAMPESAVPTLDLTVHTRTDLSQVVWNEGDWVLVRFTSRLAHGGYVEEDGELWTTDGTLLAQSRQLALAL